jgi:hypothetical protein
MLFKKSTYSTTSYLFLCFYWGRERQLSEGGGHFVFALFRSRYATEDWHLFIVLLQPSCHTRDRFYFLDYSNCFAPLAIDCISNGCNFSFFRLGSQIWKIEIPNVARVTPATASCNRAPLMFNKSIDNRHTVRCNAVPMDDPTNIQTPWNVLVATVPLLIQPLPLPPVLQMATLGGIFSLISEESRTMKGW